MMDELIKIEEEKNKKEKNEKEELIKKLEEEIKNKDNIIKNKEEMIIQIQNQNKSLEENLILNKEQNNIKFKEKEQKINNLEQKINDIKKENEEILKNKEEQFKVDKDKYDSQIKEIKEINEKLKLDLENSKKEISGKEIITDNGKNEITEIQDTNTNNEKPISISLPQGNSELLKNILPDILLNLDIQKHFLSLFYLLNKTLENYEKLKYFENTYHNNLTDSSLDSIYYFYIYIKSYINIGQDLSSLKDLLSQNSFNFSNDINETEISEKIKAIKLGEDINITELYEKKKEEYIKKMETIFDSLKQKMLQDINNNKNKIEIKKNNFIKVVEPKMELEVNFDELNKNNSIAKFQIFNSFNKVEELTLLISNFPVFLIYTLAVRCTELRTLKIFFITEKGRSKNNENIENICQVIPILIKLMNKLEALELVNFPVKPNKIPEIVESLKISKIKKLSLINCFAKKDGVTSLIPYFSFPSKNLTEINISEYYFDIISFLTNSILNTQYNKNLTSINFTNCKLSDDDINHISNFIVSSTSLVCCDISKNILSTKSCSQFGYCILKTSSLETLKMNECGINGESLPFLFNAKGSKCIKQIYLNNNNFGDIGLVSVGAFIKGSPEMEIVEVKNCGGTDMGFMNLSNNIKIALGNKLKYVNYLENNITSMTIGALAQFNEIFKNKGVVFALNKIPGETDKIKLDCAVFK